MSSGEEEKQGDEKGFAGLSSMVSDIDATIAGTLGQVQGASLGSSSQQSAQTSRQVHQEPSKPTPQSYQPPTQPSGGSSTGKWVFGIAALIGVMWLITSQSGNNRSSGLAYSPGTSSTSVAQAPAWQSPAVKPQAPSRPVEDKPSVGRNNVLSTEQIHYCLAEKMRIDASDSVLDNQNESDVNRFNAFVDDYNSRCGEFRYRDGTLESARADVERHRGQLETEGRNRFARSPAAIVKAPTRMAARPMPDATVQAIQRRLNELGYDAGNADGLFGDKTHLAIQAFQRDSGLVSDGIASTSLLTQLNATALNSSSSLNGGTIRGGGAERAPNVAPQPQNARQSEPSRDKANFAKCIGGQYPVLCDHSLLTQSEAARVDAAERKANFAKCIGGQYPVLCDHSLLTQSEAARVDAAERKANFAKCIGGQYPVLCDHSLLTQSEAARVDAAERKANFAMCIGGQYPALCDHSKLSSQEAIRVGDAERRAVRSY